MLNNLEQEHRERRRISQISAASENELGLQQLHALREHAFLIVTVHCAEHHAAAYT